MAGRKRWDSKTGNELELLPSLSSISSVASSERDSVSSLKKDQKWHRRLAVILRASSLKVLPDLGHEDEERKVAMEKGRQTAMIRCLVHVAPLVVATILIYLNLAWSYVGSMSWGSEGVVALQFAAKLHEVAMIASLTTAFLAWLRYEIMSDSGLPFGAAFAGLRVQNLTYLWSPELLGSLRSKSFGWLFKIKLALLVSLVSALMATVGPASAACMIPRDTYWPWFDSVFTVNFTKAALYPKTLTDAAYGNLADTWNSNPEWPLPLSRTESFLSSLISLEPVLSNCSEWDESNPGFANTGLWSPIWTLATFTLSLETAPSADSIDNAATSIQVQGVTGLLGDPPSGFVADIEGALDAFSNVQCLTDNQVLWNISDPGPSLDFSANSSLSNSDAHLSEAEYQRIASDCRTAFNGESYQIVSFVDIPNSNNGTGAVIANITNDRPSVVSLMPCTIQLGWFPTTVRYDGGMVSSKGPPQHNDPGIIEAATDKAWLQSANPFLPAANASAFEFLSFAAPASVTLSALLTITLAVTSPAPGACGTWYHYGNYTEYQDTVDTDCESIPDDVGKAFPLQFPVKWSRSGYGYGTNVLTVRISLALLFTYCIMAATHTVYSIWTGISSSAWDSVVGAVALAMTSQPAKELHNSCAGIETTKIFEHKVRIASTVGDARARTNEGDIFEALGSHLELLFPSTDGLAVSKVKINRKYGAMKQKVE